MPFRRSHDDQGTEGQLSDAERSLVCAECGAVSEAGAVGWRAYLADDGEAAVAFCPECAKREFGERRGRAMPN